ncbi:sugar MFS transporter [Pontiella sp.]|uniref:MFS transporter n=1 Tax=Pontiella sp. TaxID=2837462 RepID=UPI003565914F
MMVKIVALLGVFGLGMCFALLGSVSVKLMPRLKIDQGKFGSLISAFMFTSLVASLIMGVVTDQVGYKPVAMFGFVVTAVVIFMLAYAKSYGATLVACLLLGFGAMALNTAGNTLIPQVLFGGEKPAEASNMGNVFFGLGLFLTPMIVSFLFRKTSYEKAVSALGVIILIPVVCAATATYPESANAFAIGDAVALLAKPAVLLAAFVLFCYIALESSFCNWLPAFGKEVIMNDTPDAEEEKADASAQNMLSMFAIAMMVGRLVFSALPKVTVFGGYYIAGAALAAGLIIMAMTRCKSAKTSRILAAAAGFAFAPCFPTTVGITFAKFSPELYGSIFGIIFAVGLLGGVIIPKTIGNMAGNSTIQKSLKLLLPACGLLIILALVLGYLK